jgi:hypothetical protein
MCRLQFNQLLPYDALHPIEILQEAYASNEDQKKALSRKG